MKDDVFFQMEDDLNLLVDLRPPHCFQMEDDHNFSSSKRKTISYSLQIDAYLNFLIQMKWSQIRVQGANLKQ
jgi:hypothetical protein